MKCPVSMLPSAGGSSTAVLFVIAAIAAMAYALHSNQQTNNKKTA